MIRVNTTSNKSNSVCSFNIARLIGTFLFLFTVCCGTILSASDASAQDYNWELNLGFGYNGIIDYEWVHNSYPTHLDPGFAFMANIGYRFSDWFSLNIDQSFANNYSRNDIVHYDEFGTVDEPSNIFQSQTAIAAKFIFANASKDFELYLKIGIGAFINRSDYSDGEHCDSAWLSWYFPLAVGMNYYITEKVGFGFNFEYDTIIFISGSLKTTAHLAVRF